MFTGLIREIGTLRRIGGGDQLSRLEIHAPAMARRVGEGDSLAVDGICLTVTAVRGELVRVDAARETRRVTTLAGWRRGRRLHLEPSLRAGDAIDGHLVLGHVDGAGRILAVERRGGSVDMTVHCGEELARWLMPKGSVAVDGVSLTVDAGPHRDRFRVNLIPHTLRWTTFGEARPGRAVNLEMDVLVKAARRGRTAEALRGLQPTDPASREAPPAGGRVPSLAYILDRGFNRRGNS